MMKKNKTLKQAAQERYANVLIILKRKTIKSLKNMPDKWAKASKPTKVKLLRHLPVKEGTQMRDEMNAFMAGLKGLEYYKDKTLQQPLAFWKKLTQIQHINIQKTSLQSIPDDFFVLPSLKRIHLIENPIDTLPILTSPAPTTCLVWTQSNIQEWTLSVSSMFPDLVELFLQDNQLKTVSFGKEQQLHLRRLSLNNNQLSVLPDAIEAFANLEELHLSNNCLLYTSPSPRDRG